MNRQKFLIAYDISNPKRLRKVFRHLNGFKVAGQKSLFEIWVTPSELIQITNNLKQIIKPEEDRVHILGLDDRMSPLCFGVAVTFQLKFFTII